MIGWPILNLCFNLNAANLFLPIEFYRMYRSFLLFTLSVSIVSLSCNDSEVDSPYASIVSVAPYRNITDSIEKSPQDHSLYFRRGNMLREKNNLEPALYDYRKAWQLQKKEEYGVAISNILLYKDADSAISFLRPALQEFPNSLFLKLNLAEAYSRKNLDDDLLTLLNDIIAQEPGQIDALMIKSDLLKKKGSNDEAIETLERAYSMAPFDVEVAYNLAFAYADNKNAKAISLSDSLIRADSSETHAEPYYFKGIYFSNISNNQKAIELFDEAIKHDYNFLDAYREKGIILYDQKKYNEALKVFQLATTVSPTYAHSYYWMGKTQEALNQKEEAKLNYERAYGLDKSLIEAKEAAEKI